MPKILIVDDEWLTRLEIEELLNELGYEVAGQAETGEEAIAMARELNPDLILMDVVMPGGMNGIDAARVIKAELGIPIVFISGYGDPEYIEAAKEIAPFGYLSEKERIVTILKPVVEYAGTYERVCINPMTARIIENAFEIDDIPELHNRIIAATASARNVPLITNDPVILESKSVRTVW